MPVVPPPIDLEALFRRLSREQTDWLAARVMRSIVLLLAVVVGVGSVLTLLAGNQLGLVWPRLAMTLLLLLAAGLASALVRRQRPRQAAWLMVGCLFLVLDGAGFGTRLGLGSVAMVGLALLVTIVGALLGFRGAMVLALAHMAALVLAAQLHQRTDWLISLGPRPVSDILLGQLLLTLASLAGAGVAARQVGATLNSTLADARRARELLRISADWTFLLDPQGQLSDLSSGFEAHTGLPPGLLLPPDGQPRPPLREDEGARTLRAAVAARQPFRDLRLSVDLPDGRWLTMQCNGEPLHDEHGQFLGWWGSARHVNAQVLVEQALAEARRKAEAANEAKSAFLATMSHEVRTPINGVLGLARLLRQLPPDQAAQRDELLTLLEGSAQELSALVNDVLDLSRMEAGKLSLRPVRLALRGLVEASFRAPAVLGRERGLEMTLTIDPEVPQLVEADPVRLRQILANLLGNALKFTHRGGISLHLRRSASGVRFDVRDTGVGVPAEMRPRLFQPFEQADSSRRRRHGGSGLGLSICAELARLMGGSISLAPQTGTGSCFVVELPLVELAQPHTRAGDAARPLRLDGLQVLLVEDNPVNMLVAAAVLRELGASVLEACEGEQALHLARTEAGRLHLVLMDLHMPGMDGFESTAALRADPLTTHLPVVALSASVLADERQRALAAGMADFLVKPIEPDELLRALQPYLPATAA